MHPLIQKQSPGNLKIGICTDLLSLFVIIFVRIIQPQYMPVQIEISSLFLRLHGTLCLFELHKCLTVLVVLLYVFNRALLVE